MSIREYELFHGAVLTRLVRSDRPLTLRMIETRPGDAWSIYRVNDSVRILLKHSVQARALRRQAAKAWQFVFSHNQMTQLSTPDTWAALVCGSKSMGARDMEVCLLDPDDLGQLLDLSSARQQSLSIKRLGGRSLRVFSSRVASDLVVPRNRLDTWEVPGS